MPNKMSNVLVQSMGLKGMRSLNTHMHAGSCLHFNRIVKMVGIGFQDLKTGTPRSGQYWMPEIWCEISIFYCT